MSPKLELAALFACLKNLKKNVVFLEMTFALFGFFDFATSIICLIDGSSPRSALLGHFIALAVGYLSLSLFGFLDAPSVLEVGFSWARVGAATLSVGLTGALILLARDSHPPAGAMALIGSLGLLATPHAVLVMALSVVLLTATGWTINRTLGVPVPVWSRQ